MSLNTLTSIPECQHEGYADFPWGTVAACTRLHGPKFAGAIMPLARPRPRGGYGPMSQQKPGRYSEEFTGRLQGWTSTLRRVATGAGATGTREKRRGCSMRIRCAHSPPHFFRWRLFV